VTSSNHCFLIRLTSRTLALLRVGPLYLSILDSSQAHGPLMALAVCRAMFLLWVFSPIFRVRRMLFLILGMPIFFGVLVMRGLGGEILFVTFFGLRDERTVYAISQGTLRTLSQGLSWCVCLDNSSLWRCEGEVLRFELRMGVLRFFEVGVGSCTSENYSWI